jgi:hypothetical protein
MHIDAGGSGTHREVLFQCQVPVRSYGQQRDLTSQSFRLTLAP